MEAFADPPQGVPPAVPLGQLLAAERERQGLSRADAAQRLHMSAWQVEALEAGDYGRLPKGPFLRGFVRNYTKMLGLNSQAALDALAAAAPATPAPRIVVPSQNIRFDPLGERFGSPYVKAWGVAGVMFALASAAMYWWLFVRTAPPATQQAARKEAPASAPAPQNLAAAPVPAPEPVAEPREAPKLEEPAKAEAPKAEKKAEASRAEKKAEPRAEAKAAPAQSPVLGAADAPARSSKPPDVLPAAAVVPQPRAPGTRTVTLRFKGNSWVEIRDRSGKVLLSRLNEAGSEAEVSGRPPFTVVVGNAPDVTMLYDDREFPLEPHTKVAVARFTLE
jgi:cytoskeleton protein RodZ